MNQPLRFRNGVLPFRKSALPRFLRQEVPKGAAFFAVTQTLAQENLPTVCEEARCPNRSHCYARGALTFQILGRICTRRCSFCAETTGQPNAWDPTEPERIARSVERLALRHVVLTAPARDDLADGGAAAFAQTVQRIHATAPTVTVEVLTSDFAGNFENVRTVCRAQPDVFNHNIETVERLSSSIRAKATYARSLEILRFVAQEFPQIPTKSGVMVGLGETPLELETTLRDLRAAGVRFLTVGQYLPPSAGHAPLVRFYDPQEFAALEKHALAIGFDQVFSGPLVRSSFHAGEMQPQISKNKSEDL